jgi:hypothetical protein
MKERLRNLLYDDRNWSTTDFAEEFKEFKTQITSRFDNLMKGYGKFEGKFDVFNQI